MSERCSRAGTIALWCALAITCWTLRPAHASLVLAMDVADLTSAAERVVVAEVLSVRTAWDSTHTRILSHVELQVAESWKGDVRGDGKMSIVQPGGVVDGVEMRVHGMPAFAAGERAVLFLRGGTGPTVVGLAQGKRTLRWDVAARRWMAEAPDLSAVTTVGPDGRLRTVDAGPVPLDDLRRRVRRVMGR